MKRLTEGIETKFRSFMIGLIVVLVFTIPASKGIFAKLFTVTVFGAEQHRHDLEMTADFSSGGAPRSRPVAGPMQNADSCSTGRQHSRSHHGHHRDRHAHYH